MLIGSIMELCLEKVMTDSMIVLIDDGFCGYTPDVNADRDKGAALSETRRRLVLCDKPAVYAMESTVNDHGLFYVCEEHAEWARVNEPELVKSIVSA